ncbi:hypothetical protein Emed_006678 [Eimeria media]
MKGIWLVFALFSVVSFNSLELSAAGEDVGEAAEVPLEDPVVQADSSLAGSTSADLTHSTDKGFSLERERRGIRLVYLVLAFLALALTLVQCYRKFGREKVGEAGKAGIGEGDGGKGAAPATHIPNFGVYTWAPLAVAAIS